MKNIVEESGSGTELENGLQPVPVYYNPYSGSSEKVLGAIRDDVRVQLRAATPGKMPRILKSAVEQGAKRVLISGGDGTIGLAASILAGQTTELAVIPSGTLNHFAQRTGIPAETGEAINVALQCRAQPVDVGYVNDSLFINTSSVGAYPVFVRSRNYLENRMHYLPASLIAGIRRLIHFRTVRVSVRDKKLRTPLVFIGVAERELRLPMLGQVKDRGSRGLHIIAIDCRSKIKVFMLALKSIFLGIDPLKKEMSLENELVHDIELNFHRHRKVVTVALDGELNKFRAPLRYRFAPDELLVALPDTSNQ